MDFKPIPYEGNEPYIFVSYCHKDKDYVYLLIQDLIQNGYRVWFDNGIHTGDDWPETIAQHINNSKVCVAIITEASSNSHNCKNEINYALEQRIALLPILHSQFEMSPGLRLLIGSTQYIKEYDFDLSNQEEAKQFYRQLLESEQCRICRKREFGGRSFRPVSRKASEPKIEHLFLDDKGNIVNDREHAVRIITRITDSSGHITETEEIIKKSFSRFGLLVDLKTGVYYHLSAAARIGRDSANEVCLPDKTISSRHALISLAEGLTATITDLNSTNGTYLFGERIKKGDTVPLFDQTVLAFADHQYLYLENASARDAIDRKVCGMLECIESGEIIGAEQGFILGRDNPWPNGTFGEEDEAYRYLSHNHGYFQSVSGGFIFVSGRSTNGTFFNGLRLEEGNQTGLLKNGDELNIAGKHRIKYYAVELKEKEYEED